MRVTAASEPPEALSVAADRRPALAAKPLLLDAARRYRASAPLEEPEPSLGPSARRSRPGAHVASGRVGTATSTSPPRVKAQRPSPASNGS